MNIKNKRELKIIFRGEGGGVFWAAELLCDFFFSFSWWFIILCHLWRKNFSFPPPPLSKKIESIQLQIPGRHRMFLFFPLSFTGVYEVFNAKNVYFYLCGCFNVWISSISWLKYSAESWVAERNTRNTFLSVLVICDHIFHPPNGLADIEKPLQTWLNIYN